MVRKWFCGRVASSVQKKPQWLRSNRGKLPSVTSLVSFMVTCLLHSSVDSGHIRRNDSLARAQGGIDRHQKVLASEVSGSHVVHILDHSSTWL